MRVSATNNLASAKSYLMPRPIASNTARRDGSLTLRGRERPELQRDAASLRCRRTADELDLITVGIINIHRAAGQHRMFAAARLVSGVDERVVLSVELVLGKLERQVVQLVTGRPGGNLGRLGNQDDHLGNTCMTLCQLEKHVRQARRRDHVEPEQIAVKRSDRGWSTVQSTISAIPAIYFIVLTFFVCQLYIAGPTGHKLMERFYSMPTDDFQRRRQQYAVLSSQLAQFDDAQLRLLFDTGEASSGWGQNHTIELNRSRVFVKRLPVTDRENSNRFATGNLFALPAYYNYGVGWPGLGCSASCRHASKRRTGC